MKHHAQQNFSDFIKHFELEKIQYEELYYRNSKIVTALHEAIAQNNISFLAVGARGRSAGSSVMLGSVTEQLIKNINIPLLAVKKKGTGLNILDAILS